MPSMTATVLRKAALATALVLGNSPAEAADQGIFGKKLLIKNPPSGTAGNKVVHLSKDPTISVGPAGGAGDPQCLGAGGGGTSSIRIIASGGAGDVTIPLPCANWTTNAGNDLYKYRDPSGDTCSIVLVKSGALAKAVCKGPQVAVDVFLDMSPVAVVTTVNTERYCTEFGGSVIKSGSDGKTFLRKDAPPTGCPATTTTTAPPGPTTSSTSSTTTTLPPGSTTTTLPPGTTCCQLASDVCFDMSDQEDIDLCSGSGGTPTSGVCDAATGTCQGSSSGSSFCCRDTITFPCSQGPGTSDSACYTLGGVFADDSCAAGCVPSSETRGSPGTGDGQFSEPQNVVIDGNGNIFVAENLNRRVQKFDSSWAFLTKWGSIGNGDGEFGAPIGLDVDGNGDVFVSDSDIEVNGIFNLNGNNRVQKFTNTGTFISKWGSYGSQDGQFLVPAGVAVDASGNVFVVDLGNHRVQKFTNTGTFVSKWGSLGTGDGQFNRPYGIAVDASGNVFVSDMENDRIQKFTNTGTFLTTWGSVGSGDGQFSLPRGLTVDGSGNVYVADRYNYRVQKFTNTGTYITQWGSYGSGYAQLDEPNAVAVDASGNIYVADTKNHRIHIFFAP